MSEEGTCSLQEPGGLCVHVRAIATGELSLVAGSCDGLCVWEDLEPDLDGAVVGRHGSWGSVCDMCV